MYDVAIIGAGVIGCSILNKLTRLGVSCIALEKGLDVAVGTSKSNSGLIHAGFDCAENSLKAKLNYRGNKLYYKLCQQLDVPIKKTGALVVGSDLNVITALYNRGLKNGLTKNELVILNKEQLFKFNPNFAEHVNYGLYARTAGIVSPYLFTIALAEEALLNGGDVKLDFKVIKVEEQKGKYIIISSKNEKIEAKIIINASGYAFNEVSKAIGAETYDIFHKRGEYYVFDSTVKNLTNLTLFPLPSAVSKGVVITPTVDGNYLVGPTSTVSEYSVKTTAQGLSEIREKATEVLKVVPFNKTIRVFSGVRSSCGHDFIIEKSALKENLINLAGIDSPGLSSAPAIAEYVANLLGLENKEKKMTRRNPYTDINKLTDNQLNELIKNDPDYGVMVCRCENITLGQIKEAINSPLRPRTVDAIKRRVRAGMGRCQGSFCFLKVAQTIAETYGIKLEDVNKEDQNSNFIVGDIKGGDDYGI